MRRKIAGLLALAALAAGLVPARAEPTTFKVGFAVRKINPSCEGCRAEGQYLGGFGQGDPVTTVHDPLEVRAMAISNGTKTIALAIVDTQGYFSGSQEGPWGNRNAREDAAAALGIAPGDIIVSSTHSHAAPTIMGIWGPTDPAYLKYVHDQTVAAIVAAGTPSEMKDAELLSAEADVSDTIISGIEQTDGYQGWRVDGNTPVLWARDPTTKATLGLYANVPVHADVVNGLGLNLMSADHIGVERMLLDADLGGTSVIAMGTLGRQEGTVQTDGLAAANRLGIYVTNEIERALASAQPITDTTLASAEQYVLVPGTNPLLAALNYGNAAPGCPCNVPGVDTWTIDRALTPPFLAGGAFGTWITALRIGHVVYASEPGEGFPEVSTSIRTAYGGAADVRIVGMAQDQLGYYYPPETYPFTFTNPSDHHIYNASLLLADINANAHALNAAALGFTPTPNHETIQFDNPASILEAGVQWFPTKRESVASTLEITGYTSEPAYTDIVPGATLDNLGEGGECPHDIGWSFDGTTAGGGCGQIVSATFAGPGAYDVVASVVDGRTGNTITWSGRLYVDPPLTATVTAVGDVLTAGVSGGQGTILAAHWTFDDATSAHGLMVVKPGAHGTAEVVDGAGNHATANF
jgi:hypothetical protein